MMATVPHVTSGWGLRKFQADGFLFDRVYKKIQVLLDMGQCFSVNTNVSGQISVSVFKFDVHGTVHL